MRILYALAVSSLAPGGGFFMLFFKCVEVRLRDAEGDGLSNGLKTLMIQAVTLIANRMWRQK